jgi:GDPmannose 4,6-dehydratase
VGKGNPSKAKKQLGWEAKYKMADVVRMMVNERLES